MNAVLKKHLYSFFVPFISKLVGTLRMLAAQAQAPIVRPNMWLVRRSLVAVQILRGLSNNNMNDVFTFLLSSGETPQAAQATCHMLSCHTRHKAIIVTLESVDLL